MDERKEKLREAFAPISFELFNLVNLLSCSEHARDSVRHRVEGEIAQFWHEIQVAELAGPQPSLPRLGAQKHLETCCACNHGRTPCEEYRRNYENSSAVAGMEHPNGKISSVGDGLDIKQTASQPAPPSLSALSAKDKWLSHKVTRWLLDVREGHYEPDEQTAMGIIQEVRDDAEPRAWAASRIRTLKSQVSVTGPQRGKGK